ncbi:MAG: LacI family DNA-binding transcriptional regulator [Steroidobacteraceae bacterium]
MKTPKLTSLEVAQLAQVSQATVSRALRDSPLVKPETRARVQEIARELHYRTDRSAAGLRTRRSRTLALLLFEESPEEGQINPFFLAMLGHIARAAARRSFDLLVSFQQLSDDWHTDYELSNRADGLILLGYGDYLSYADRLRHLAETDAHFVIWGPVVENQPGHYLCCDNVLGARLATRRLLEQGRRQIAFAGGASDHCPEFQLRHRGYAEALRESGAGPDTRLHAEAQSNEADGYRAGQRLLDSGVPFDAVFAASDLIAMGVIHALQDRGLAVPGDVAVVGFDDIASAADFNPPLTTVRQDTRLAGELLVDNLIRLIEGRAVELTAIAPELVIRASCGRRSAA